MGAEFSISPVPAPVPSHTPPPPKPKPTQAEQLAAAEACIHDIVNQFLSFWPTSNVSTLKDAQFAR